MVSLVLLSQIPFAYRRYRLGRLNANIQLVNSSRHLVESASQFNEYKGVAHVHSFLGGHSTGTFSEIISAAQSNQLDFVIMTEHPAKDFDTAEMTLRGTHGGVLFVNGSEISKPNGDRVLLLPGSKTENSVQPSPGQIPAEVSHPTSVTLIAYPADFKDWDAGGYDGVEVYNVYTNARRINPIVAFFDSLWSLHSYHDLLFATFYKRPTESLERWDLALTHRRLTATAGNDAHSNIGVSVSDGGGKTLLGLRLDPYETSFRLVRLHVLIPQTHPLDSDTLIRSIKDGHCFIGFDLFGDSTGFSFTAQNASDTRIQGDEIALQAGTQLAINVPVSSRVLVYKDGKVYRDEMGLTYRAWPIAERGIYRVEVYLPQLGSPAGDQPWIISNPIYVK